MKKMPVPEAMAEAALRSLLQFNHTMPPKILGRSVRSPASRYGMAIHIAINLDMAPVQTLLMSGWRISGP